MTAGEGAIVVTGARGYIASALARRLAARGRALRLVSRSADMPKIAQARAPVEYVQADLRSVDSWRRLMGGAEAIIHLSSRTDLRAADADPSGDEAINVDPVRALAAAAERSGIVPKIAFASTVTIVGPQHENPVSERTPDHPCSTYDRHKLACETILRDITKAGLLEACSLRLPNVYGPGASINSNRGILNLMVRRALSGEPLTLYGGGRSIRDFTYLDDVVEAFVAAIDANVCNGSSYVIATGQGHTLADAYRLIADAAFAATGRHAEIVNVPEPADLHPIERRNFIGDSSLFQRRTGWRPTMTLPDGIKRFMAESCVAQTMTTGE
jgi:nucleoside-diphosphate-sugar epimerase